MAVATSPLAGVAGARVPVGRPRESSFRSFFADEVGKKRTKKGFGAQPQGRCNHHGVVAMAVAKLPYVGPSNSERKGFGG